MVLDLYFSPLKPEHAFGVNDKSAALNTSHLSSIHLLKLDDVKGGAQFLLWIRNKIERKLLFGFKILLRLSREAPRITADWRLNLLIAALKSSPSCVQPGVLAFG